MVERVLKTQDDPDLGPHAPRAIKRPFMAQRWRDVSFLHWRCDAEAMQRLLPPGVEVDRWDGSAWVGVIPFHLSVRLPAWAPAIPWLQTTPEVNVRTYVRGPDGRRGIWFLSLEASRLAVVATARAWYRIPYRWARTHVAVQDRTVTCETHRRSASFSATLEVGEQVDELSPLERFLICRWRLYSPGRGGRVWVSEIDHAPWRLRRARVTGCDESLVAPVPEGLPVAHHSPGVDVRWARRERASTRAPA